MTGNEIREAFLKYFEEHGHTRVRSSPLLPTDDPTLLFTNAGMNQFKDTFLGMEKRDYVRAASSQKCVRAGGKHNDLDEVGKTARHHTFFEMLGNFSFGDYFKDDAIKFAWEFLVDELKLDPARLWFTVYEGDAEVPPDEDAERLWEKVGAPRARILRFGRKDNFWQMGETGPCGPCSEIHYDLGQEAAEPGREHERFPGDAGGRFVEIWNLVFMQFNRDASGAMTPLPRPSIDTGMGLERIAAVLQGKRSNYDSDLLAPLVQHVARLSSKRYGADEDVDVSLRVIADHARATTFLIADGVLPSNEWRGYVLRRIMRRAMRHGRKLGLTEPFLWRGVDWVGEVMGPAYPESVRERDRIVEVVRQEEEQFAKTLDHGMRRIEEYTAAQGAGAGRAIDGRFLFTLYDTFGFPRDLAEEILADQGWRVTDETNGTWDQEMEAQRERARARAAFGVDGEAPEALALYQQVQSALARPQQFVGYETLTTPATLLALIADGRRVGEVTAGDEVEVILDRTPGYAESGGQIGDTGTLVGRGGQGEIVDTYYRGPKLIVHRVKVRQGGFHENEEVAVTVDSPRRQGLRQHHTGTHLLHAALRKVLGTHVSQAGSLVAPDHLRFDFSHGGAVKDREVEQIEELVNEQVQANTPVTHEVMGLKDAMASGAMALFGEKYGDRVRVVRIGDFSTELCGGTHLDATGQIGLLKVDTEGAVASGVRRIEAVAGAAAVESVTRQQRVLREIGDILKIAPADAPQRLRKLLDEQRALETQLRELEGRLARSRADDLVAAARQVNGVAVVAGRIDGLDPDGLRAVADRLRDRLGSGVVCVGSVAGDKVNLVAAVTKDLTKRFHAGKLVQEVARAVGGSGGGRPDLAQAGGKDPGKLDSALDGVYDAVARTGA